jgi:hypothetical protein
MGDSPAMAKYLALFLKIHVRELPDMPVVMVIARVDVNYHRYLSQIGLENESYHPLLMTCQIGLTGALHEAV